MALTGSGGGRATIFWGAQGQLRLLGQSKSCHWRLAILPPRGVRPSGLPPGFCPAKRAFQRAFRLCRDSLKAVTRGTLALESAFAGRKTGGRLKAWPHDDLSAVADFVV